MMMIAQQGLHDFLRALSTEDFLNLGLGHIAYIRESRPQDRKKGKMARFVVYGADGQELAKRDSESSALNAIQTNDMEAIRLH